MSGLKGADIHALIDSTWPAVLAKLGIAESFLRLKKSGPCPACSGRDRYVFDNRHGRGDFFCRHCGAGDGFELLQRVHGWNFATARREVMRVAQLGDTQHDRPADRNDRPCDALKGQEVAKPSARLLSILRSACAVSDCPDAVTYLESRKLWPLPAGCTLRAHAGLDYWRVGRYPALVAEVRDIHNELVTLHVTYLQDGRKLEGREPRKLLSPLAGRKGCAIRLSPAAETLGIAEGIETALSAFVITGVPCWAALNTSLLSKFEPPPGVTTLALYADQDVPGLRAAGQLQERLQGRLRVKFNAPRSQFADFNDQLTGRSSGKGTHDDDEHTAGTT